MKNWRCIAAATLRILCLSACGSGSTATSAPVRDSTPDSDVDGGCYLMTEETLEAIYT